MTISRQCPLQTTEKMTESLKWENKGNSGKNLCCHSSINSRKGTLKGLQRHYSVLTLSSYNVLIDRARKLFKPSEEESLLGSILKNPGSFGLNFLEGWHEWWGLMNFWMMSSGPENKKARGIFVRIFF